MVRRDAGDTCCTRPGNSRGLLPPRLWRPRQRRSRLLGLLDSLIGSRLRVEHITDADIQRAAALVRTYADFHLGVVDAAVVAIAERLRVTEVATLDRRHFSTVRPTHVSAFELVP